MPMTLARRSRPRRGHRIASQSNVWLVAGDGTFQAEMINLPNSDSGEHDDTPLTYPDGNGS